MSDSSHYATIVSFPVELLQEIAKLSFSLPALRLVCKAFNDAVTPQMFSKILINFKEGKLNEFLEILEALASGAHPAILYARSLTIRYLCPSLEPERYFSRRGQPVVIDFRYPPDDEEEKRLKLEHKLKVLDPYFSHSESIRKWLPLGLSRLTEVTSVKWCVEHQRSLDWNRDCVVSGVAQMTSLTALELDADLVDAGCIVVSGFPPLQALSLNTGFRTSISDEGSIQGIPELIEKSCDRLRDLRVKSRLSYSGVGETPLVSYFLQRTPHLSLLKSLSLEGFEIILDGGDIDKITSLETLHAKDISMDIDAFDWPDDYEPKEAGNLWPQLKKKGLHLKEMTIDQPTESFMQYLGSYAGLRQLSITSASNFTENQSEILAQNFYRNALRRHFNSLQTLEIKPSYEGTWCFGEHCTKTLGSLVNLRRLSVSVVADPMEPAHSDPDPYIPEGIYIIGSEKPSIPRYDYDPSHPVCQLLNMAASLPKLEILSISGSSLKRNRGVRCGNGLSFHKVDPDTQIFTNVTSFGPIDPSEYRFTIENSGRYFKPRMIEEIGGYQYKLYYVSPDSRYAGRSYNLRA